MNWSVKLILVMILLVFTSVTGCQKSQPEEPALIEIDFTATPTSGTAPLTVQFANRAPTTNIHVDAGDHVDGDSVTIIGLTGDDNFGAVGAELVTFGLATTTLTSVENLAVLEGIRIDTDRLTIAETWTMFLDEDDNATKVKISGPGSVDIFRDIVDGRNADIALLSTADTLDTKTKLTVTVRRRTGSDNETTIGFLRGTGLSSLTATKSDLVGGIDLTTGLLRLTVDDIGDDVDILWAGRSGQKSRIKADQVGHDVNLRAATIVNDLKVRSWASGSVQATVINSIRARQGFVADLTNLRTNRNGFGIKSVSVTGNFISNIVSDRVGKIKVNNGNAQLNVTTITDAITLAGKAAVEQVSIKGGDLLESTFNLEPDTVLKSLFVRSSGGGGGGNLRGPVAIIGNLGNAKIDQIDGPFTIEGALLGSLSTNTPGGFVPIQSNGNEILVFLPDPVDEPRQRLFPSATPRAICTEIRPGVWVCERL